MAEVSPDWAGQADSVASNDSGKPTEKKKSRRPASEFSYIRRGQG